MEKEIQKEENQEVLAKKEVNVLKRKGKVILQIIGETLHDDTVTDIAWKTGIVVGSAKAVKTKSLRAGIGSTYNVMSTIVTANVGWNLIANYKKIKDA